MADKKEIEDGLQRTKKRQPGKIQRAIKVALVGDGTVGRDLLYFLRIKFNRYCRLEKHVC
jgi:hypothetical protein